MRLNVTCPKCRKTETLEINQQMLRELYSTGYTSISFYHTNHVLYVGLDKYGIRVIDVFDPPSTLVYSSNIIVDGIFIIRNPVVHLPIDILFYDQKKNIIDARLVKDHMYAIIFARYHKQLLNSDNGGFASMLGLKYYIRKNGRLVVASILNNGTEKPYVINLTERLMSNIVNVPVELIRILDAISLEQN